MDQFAGVLMERVTDSFLAVLGSCEHFFALIFSLAGENQVVRQPSVVLHEALALLLVEVCLILVVFQI